MENGTYGFKKLNDKKINQKNIMDNKSPELRRQTAIQELAPNCSYHAEADGTIIKWLTPDISQPSESDIDTKVAEYKEQFDANEYQRSRASEYPSIADQLDEIYHNGVDSWKAVIKKTKDKYPKG